MERLNGYTFSRIVVCHLADLTRASRPALPGAKRSAVCLIKAGHVVLLNEGVSLLDSHGGRLGLLDDHATQRREGSFVDPMVVLPKPRTLQRLAAVEKCFPHCNKNDQPRLPTVNGSGGQKLRLARQPRSAVDPQRLVNAGNEEQ